MTYDLYRFLAVTARHVNTTGWLSRYRARWYGNVLLATVEDVLRTYPTCAPADHEWREAAEAITWARAADPADQAYQKELSRIARFGIVMHHEAGTAASMLVAYRRVAGVPTKLRYVVNGAGETQAPRTLQPAS